MRSMLFYSRGVLALGTFVVLGGCGTKQSSSLPPAPIQWDEDGHDHAVHIHPTEGPHHGELIELGSGRYHAELVHDEKSHTVRIYILDIKARGSVPVAEQNLTINLVVHGKPVQFKLSAVPLDVDPAGHSSHFERTDQNLCDALHHAQTIGRFNVTIEGKTFVGQIENHAHADKHHHEHAVTASRPNVAR